MNFVFPSSVVVAAEVHPAVIIRTSRAGPATALGPGRREMFGASQAQDGPRGAPQVFLGSRITTG